MKPDVQYLKTSSFLLSKEVKEVSKDNEVEICFQYFENQSFISFDI